MSLTYSQYVSSLANRMPVPTSDPGFTIELPNIIDAAELRCYRDLQLQNTSVRDSSATFTTSSRNFTLPTASGTFVVTQQLNVITPAGTTDPELGTRTALIPASQEMLNAMWPSVAGSTVPQYFAMVNDNLAIVGPWPDAAYNVEAIGTIRPAPLSSTNVTTLLSVNFPDQFLAASMVIASGYMKNFGAGVDDPKMAMTWETIYQATLKGASIEEAMKQFQGPAWSSSEPTPMTPPRT